MSTYCPSIIEIMILSLYVNDLCGFSSKNDVYHNFVVHLAYQKCSLGIRNPRWIKVTWSVWVEMSKKEAVDKRYPGLCCHAGKQTVKAYRPATVLCQVENIWKRDHSLPFRLSRHCWSVWSSMVYLLVLCVCFLVSSCIWSRYHQCWHVQSG